MSVHRVLDQTGYSFVERQQDASFSKRCGHNDRIGRSRQALVGDCVGVVPRQMQIRNKIHRQVSSILNFTGPAKESAVPHAPIPRQHTPGLPPDVFTQAAERDSFAGSRLARLPPRDYRESWLQEFECLASRERRHKWRGRCRGAAARPSCHDCIPAASSHSDVNPRNSRILGVSVWRFHDMPTIRQLDCPGSTVRERLLSPEGGPEVRMWEVCHSA